MNTQTHEALFGILKIHVGRCYSFPNLGQFKSKYHALNGPDLLFISCRVCYGEMEAEGRQNNQLHFREFNLLVALTPEMILE